MLFARLLIDCRFKVEVGEVTGESDGLKVDELAEGDVEGT